MKTQEHIKGNPTVQGTSKANRNFMNQKEAEQQLGVSNGGGQRSDQTSRLDNIAKPRRKML